MGVSAVSKRLLGVVLLAVSVQGPASVEAAPATRVETAYSPSLSVTDDNPVAAARLPGPFLSAVSGEVEEAGGVAAIAAEEVLPRSGVISGLGQTYRALKMRMFNSLDFVGTQIAKTAKRGFKGLQSLLDANDPDAKAVAQPGVGRTGCLSGQQREPQQPQQQQDCGQGCAPCCVVLCNPCALPCGNPCPGADGGAGPGPSPAPGEVPPPGPGSATTPRGSAGGSTENAVSAAAPGMLSSSTASSSSTEPVLDGAGNTREPREMLVYGEFEAHVLAQDVTSGSPSSLQKQIKRNRPKLSVKNLRVLDYGKSRQ